MKTKLILCCLAAPLFLFAQANCPYPDATADAEWNDLTLTFTQGGIFNANEFTIVNQNGSFTFNRGQSIWCGAKIGEFERVSVSPHFFIPEVGDTDYFAGPLGFDGDPLGSEVCNSFNRFFRVNLNEVVDHITDYEADNEINEEPHINILAWPGKGNPLFSSIHGWDSPDIELAPFIDRNENGIYEPMLGDYPKTYGSWNIWKIMNDASNLHTESNGAPLKLSIQMMYYGQLSEEPLNTTYFSRIIVTNRNPETLEEFKLGLRSEGNFTSVNYGGIGCKPAGNYSFSYSVDTIPDPWIANVPNNVWIDKILPAQSETEVGTMDGFSIFMNPGEAGPPSYFQDAFTVPEYYNYLQGEWRDGTPITFGGNGYMSGAPTRYMYSGDLDDPEAWSLCNADTLFQYDYRGLMVSDLGDLVQGESRTVSYAHTFLSEVGLPCQNGLDLDAIVEDITNAAAENPLISSLNNRPDRENTFELYPNPTQSNVLVKLKTGLIENLEVYSLTGQSLIVQQGLNQKECNLSLSDLSPGIFIIKVKNSLGTELMQKVVKL